MTIAAVVHFNVECPVHAEQCGYRWYSPVANTVGSVLGLCEKCGYQTEMTAKFGVRYRRMDDASILMSEAEFERGRK